jgi:beta-barrel assembly-enhancing protease
MMNRLLTLVSMLVICVLPMGCKTTRAVETGAAAILVSDEQEGQLGLQVKDELTKQGVKYLNDPQVLGYVQSMATPILRAAEEVRPGVKWQLAVIDDPKTVNAFATPGGYLYVYTGLLMAAENEAELAGVMAHEAGHVAGRHSARQLVNAYGLQAIASMALGKDPGLLQQVGAAIVGNGAMLAHSRADETEADEMGATFSAKAGYDPKGLSSFFGKLMKGQGSTPKVLTWLSTHPATDERVQHVNEYIAEHRLSGSKVQSNEFLAVKQKLGATSPSTAAPAAAAPAQAQPPPANTRVPPQQQPSNTQQAPNPNPPLPVKRVP